MKATEYSLHSQRVADPYVLKIRAHFVVRWPSNNNSIPLDNNTAHVVASSGGIIQFLTKDHDTFPTVERHREKRGGN